MGRKRQWRYPLGCVAFVVASYCCLGLLLWLTGGLEAFRYDRVKPGMSERQVLALLGAPDRVVEPGATGRQYAVIRPAPEGPAPAGGAFVYIGRGGHCYVLFGRDGMVTDVSVFSFFWDD